MENTDLQTMVPANIDTVELVEIVKSAPAILEQNTISHDKAMEYGENLIKQAQSGGMNDNLDNIMAQYQGKLRTTLKSMNDRRKAFTQITDNVKRFFTGLESDINPQNKASIYVRVQEMRNKYATAKIEELRRKEREAQEQIRKETERIEVKKQAAIKLNELYQLFLVAAKNELTEIFESLTLSNIDKGQAIIFGYKNAFTEDDFRNLRPEISSLIIGKDEIGMLISCVKTNLLYGEYKLDFATEISNLKRELIDKIPSKKVELEEIARASAAEAERLKAEAERRKIEEQRKHLQEAEEKQQVAIEKANVEAVAETMDKTTDAQANLFGETPKVVEGFEIIIKNPVAYALIFQFWFDKEGKRLPVDKLERYTVARMKKFCEDYAVKNSEKITSPLVEYREIYKAK